MHMRRCRGRSNVTQLAYAAASHASPDLLPYIWLKLRFNYPPLLLSDRPD